jgi:hypothetical protein
MKIGIIVINGIAQNRLLHELFKFPMLSEAEFYLAYIGAGEHRLARLCTAFGQL